MPACFVTAHYLHDPEADSNERAINIVLTWWDIDPPPRISYVRLNGPGLPGGSKTVRIIRAQWRQLTEEKREQGVVVRGAFFVHHVHVNELELLPRQFYEIRLQLDPDDHLLTQCTFETLPPDLHITGETNQFHRPFVVLLGSCFYQPEDQGVENALERLLQGPVPVPNMKFLMGDQVYVDQPPTFFIGVGSKQIRAHVTDQYIRSWTKLGMLIRSGLNVLTTDDHEFWNNYPNTPLAPWGKLNTSPNTRDVMRKVTTAFVHDVQNVKETTSFNIGPPEAPQLSFLVVDTRMNRSRGGARFVREEVLETIEKWIEKLKCPGVLVLGAPIFTYKYGKFLKVFTTDHNLPAFKQYPRLERALALAEHDILVCGGDVHFGRLASVQVRNLRRADPTTIWEVISSPLAVLPTAESAHKGPITVKVPKDEESFSYSWDFDKQEMKKVLREASDSAPIYFPWLSKFNILEHGIISGRIRYRRLVSHVPNKNHCEDHFTTLSFTANPNQGVDVEVSAWLVGRDDPENGRPYRGMHYKFNLDGGRLPADKSRVTREVTHVQRKNVLFGPVTALVNPQEPWSPRLKHEAISDIKHSRARYVINTPDGSSEVQVVRLFGKEFLRSKPNKSSKDNLSKLPPWTSTLDDLL